MPLHFSGPPTSELRYAAEWVQLNLDTPGVICPCCGQVAARRARKLHRSMAAALLLLARFFRENPGERWVHAEQHFKQHPQIPAAIRGDFPKLTHRGLLEECPETDPSADHSRSGMYRVTRRGFLFVDGAIRVPERGFAFNKELILDVTAPLITIHDALWSTFNYWELLGRPRPDAVPTGR